VLPAISGPLAAAAGDFPTSLSNMQPSGLGDASRKINQ
jgi:hypothetical protein